MISSFSCVLLGLPQTIGHFMMIEVGKEFIRLTAAQFHYSNQLFLAPLYIGYGSIAWRPFTVRSMGPLWWLLAPAMIVFQKMTHILVGGLEHLDYDFPFSWECHHPNWLLYFSEGCQPPTRGFLAWGYSQIIQNRGTMKNHHIFQRGGEFHILTIINHIITIY